MDLLDATFQMAIEMADHCLVDAPVVTRQVCKLMMELSGHIEFLLDEGCLVAVSKQCSQLRHPLYQHSVFL